MITLESLWEDYESKVSPNTAESGRQSLRDRLDICSSLSDSLVSEIQNSQSRLQDLEGQQKSFYQMDEELQRQIHDIEDQVRL